MPEIQLPDNEVHVWEGWLDRPAEVVQELHALLCADERERASRFHFERDRSRYIVGRAELRLLLARYLDTPPRELRFVYGAFDKPALSGSQLRFNLAHSGAVALYAVTRIGEVGIDVELLDSGLADERLAERFFSPSEVATLRAMPRSQRAQGFLRCWTRKEAFVKARGDGLQLALDSFDVSLARGHPVAVMRTAWSRSEPTEWSLSDLSDEDAGYIAALAIRAEPAPTVRRRKLADSGAMDIGRQEER